MDGVLVPNSELGHIEIDGHDAESKAAASARDREGLSWKDWAVRVQRYLEVVVRLLSPELVIVGGGASRKADKWLPHIDVDTEVVPAALENEAGIVGAALDQRRGPPPDLTSAVRSPASRTPRTWCELSHQIRTVLPGRVRVGGGGQPRAPAMTRSVIRSSS